MKPELKLMADYQCWPLWLTSESEFRNIDPADLGLADSLAKRLDLWAEKFDRQLNVDDPLSSEFFSPQELSSFTQEGIILWRDLYNAVSVEYNVCYFHPQKKILLRSFDELDMSQNDDLSIS